MHKTWWEVCPHHGDASANIHVLPMGSHCQRNISDILRKTKRQTSLNLICDYSLCVHRAEVRRNRNLNNLVLSADMLGRRTEPQQQKIIIIFKVMFRSTTLTETVKMALAILILVCIIKLEHLFCFKKLNRRPDGMVEMKQAT